MDKRLIEKFKDTLHTNGLKCTPERLSIFKEVYSSSGHSNADEIED